MNEGTITRGLVSRFEHCGVRREFKRVVATPVGLGLLRRPALPRERVGLRCVAARSAQPSCDMTRGLGGVGSQAMAPITRCR
jgi:hypothetical protein